VYLLHSSNSTAAYKYMYTHEGILGKTSGSMFAHTGDCITYTGYKLDLYTYVHSTYTFRTFVS